MAAETPQLKLAREQGEKNIVEQDIPLDPNGRPYLRISCSAAELIPTRQYANVTIGPVSVQRYVQDTGNEEDLKKEIRDTQKLCEEAVAEDRQTVHALIRQSDGGRYNE